MQQEEDQKIAADGNERDQLKMKIDRWQFLANLPEAF